MSGLILLGGFQKRKMKKGKSTLVKLVNSNEDIHQEKGSGLHELFASNFSIKKIVMATWQMSGIPRKATGVKRSLRP